jgi:hypothetical protein
MTNHSRNLNEWWQDAQGGPVELAEYRRLASRLRRPRHLGTVLGMLVSFLF